MRDDDRREVDAEVTKTIWLDDGPLERIEFGSNNNIYWGQDGTRRSWSTQQDIGLECRSRWTLDLWHDEEFKVFEKEFRNRATGIGVGYNTREITSASTKLKFGRSFDADSSARHGLATSSGEGPHPAPFRLRERAERT